MYDKFEFVNRAASDYSHNNFTPYRVSSSDFPRHTLDRRNNETYRRNNGDYSNFYSSYNNRYSLYADRF